ncbi:unnamed protein product [marine sediment metagenome]|uniref:Uncharacterized protein n=1 Tax=marine sediment metagenome TaxID=412755 RepID=X0U3F1_9ZZZZ
MKAIINFIKPDLKKVIFFLILITPFVIHWLDKIGVTSIDFPETFLLYFFDGIVFATAFVICGGMMCPRGGQELEKVGNVVGYFIAGIIFWLVACFLSWVWDKIISIKRKKDS